MGTPYILVHLLNDPEGWQLQIMMNRLYTLIKVIAHEVDYLQQPVTEDGRLRSCQSTSLCTYTEEMSLEQLNIIHPWNRA